MSGWLTVKTKEELSQTLVRKQRQKLGGREKEQTRHTLHRFFVYRLWALPLLLPPRSRLETPLLQFSCFGSLCLLSPYTCSRPQAALGKTFGLRPFPCHGHELSSFYECLKNLGREKEQTRHSLHRFFVYRMFDLPSMGFHGCPNRPSLEIRAGSLVCTLYIYHPSSFSST